MKKTTAETSHPANEAKLRILCLCFNIINYGAVLIESTYANSGVGLGKRVNIVHEARTYYH